MATDRRPDPRYIRDTWKRLRKEKNLRPDLKRKKRTWLRKWTEPDPMRDAFRVRAARRLEQMMRDLCKQAGMGRVHCAIYDKIYAESKGSKHRVYFRMSWYSKVYLRGPTLVDDIKGRSAVVLSIVGHRGNTMDVRVVCKRDQSLQVDIWRIKKENDKWQRVQMPLVQKGGPFRGPGGTSSPSLWQAMKNSSKNS